MIRLINGMFLYLLVGIFLISSCVEDEETDDGGSSVTGDFKIYTSDTLVFVGQSITFIDSSTNVAEREWSFEGGSKSSSKLSEETLIYEEAGEFKTAIRVNFNNGDVASDTLLITVRDFVDAEFENDLTDIEQTDYVQFNDISIGEVDKWEWTFEGGTPSTSNERNPKIQYFDIGVYDVKLKVTRTVDGMTDTYELTDLISVTELVLKADFDVDNYNFLNSGMVQFTNTSRGDEDQYLWTFEGGSITSSTDENPVVSYGSPGQYDVTLKVTRSVDGETDTYEANNFIVVYEAAPGGLVNSSGGDFENSSLASDVITMPNCRVFNYGSSDDLGKVYIEREGVSYLGSQGSKSFSLAEDAEAKRSYSGSNHLRIINEDDDRSDIEVYQASGAGLQMDHTYQVSLRVRVNSSGLNAGNGDPATFECFINGVTTVENMNNAWAAIITPKPFNEFEVDKWEVFTYQFTVTAAAPNVNAFPVLRIRGEVDVLIDDVYVTDITVP
ncbi:PKD domain-containing protein [Reichenbachiella versicolor]|uniref:PKD domain-containing protein n=1 Tax=Reichenbachiella versicolor TaxID=1821036 RepID=UPI0013A52CA5|nr:PKD domain-containing protein [Reichenbachiella versicolor]